MAGQYQPFDIAGEELMVEGVNFGLPLLDSLGLLGQCQPVTGKYRPRSYISTSPSSYFVRDRSLLGFLAFTQILTPVPLGEVSVYELS